VDRDQGGEIGVGVVAPIRVERLTPERRDDFLALFDRLQGAADVRACAASRCCCNYFHVSTAIPWESLDAAANRVAMAARIDCGEMDGFLAYANGTAVGWLNAQPCHKLSHLESRLGVAPVSRDVPAHDAAAVVCFVIDPCCEQEQAVRALLDAALASLAQRGLRMVDAFPRPSGDAAALHPDRGVPSLFLDRGFSVLREESDCVVVRRHLV
jgi:ribosomal protein S18 acetylase RimI-like enzyme